MLDFVVFDLVFQY